MPHWGVLGGLVALIALLAGAFALYDEAGRDGQWRERLFGGSESDSSAYWPTNGWRTSTPEEQGMDSDLLVQMLESVEQRDINIHSLLVIRHGHIVLDAYFYPFAPQAKHDLASVTKSFTSTLVGIAIEKGYIGSVDEHVVELFPGQTIANVDENKQMMTVQDLLTMRSGFECVNVPTEVTLNQMMGSPNWVLFTLDLPMGDEPGTRWVYCSPNVHLLSGIIRQTTGMSALDFARQHLFGPLGISEVAWPADAQGNNDGWGGLELSPHDVAKLGYLYLNGGKWDDQQVLSSEWIKAATTVHAPASAMTGMDLGYGYLWWLHSSTYSMALGRGGQSIFVIPEKDIVVVLTGGDRDFLGIYHELITSFVIPAAQSTSPLPANPSGAASLQSKIQRAAAPPEVAPPSSLPEMAGKISGKTYELSESLGLLAETTVSLDFSEQDAAQLNVGNSRQYSVGLENAYRFVPGRSGSPLGIRGSWESDDVFVVYVDEIAYINQWKYSFAFQDEGDRVTVSLEERTGVIGPRTVEGRAR